MVTPLALPRYRAKVTLPDGRTPRGVCERVGGFCHCKLLRTWSAETSAAIRTCRCVGAASCVNCGHLLRYYVGGRFLWLNELPPDAKVELEEVKGAW